jgi:L-asparaginase II
VESIHRGSLVVLRKGEVVFAAGNPDVVVCARSAVKPFQALPLIERGVAARLGLSPEELALTSASHNGTPAHTAEATRILGRGGFEPADLGLGPHPPMDRSAAIALAVSGEEPGKIHNNCSGKHAGFLLLAADMGVPPADYLDPDSSSQLLIRQTVAEMTELPLGSIGVGLDGCGAPALSLPLSGLARGFANLANPGRLGDVRRDACTTLRRSMAGHPEIYAGNGRLCTGLLRSLPGRVTPKNGAEGVYAFGLVDQEIGVAVKVDDGATRGYLPVIVDLLRVLCGWTGLPAELQDFCPVPIHNTQGRHVGEVSSTVTWPRSLRP